MESEYSRDEFLEVLKIMKENNLGITGCHWYSKYRVAWFPYEELFFNRDDKRTPIFKARVYNKGNFF